MRAGPGRGTGAALAVAALAPLVLWAAPLSPAIDSLRDPQATADRYGATALLVAAAAAACWLALAWLVTAIGILAATALPGRCGRLADALAERTIPRSLRRLVAVGLGLIVATSAATGPAHAGPAVQPPAAPPSALDLDWPVHDAHEATVGPAGPATTPRRPAVSSLAADAVVVRPGDCLWSIAADHLPRDAPNTAIAAAWPRWYSANRAVVGADPNVLLPGQHLIVPTDRPTDQHGDPS